SRRAMSDRPFLWARVSARSTPATWEPAGISTQRSRRPACSTRWREVTKDSVIRPILLQQMPLTALRYAGELLSVPGIRLPSLLDPKPLERSLKRWMSWGDLHRNVAQGLVHAVAVVATAARPGRTVAFLESGNELSAH